MKLFYLSFHPSTACVITRCFTSEKERADFRRLVDRNGANIQTWEYTPAKEAER